MEADAAMEVDGIKLTQTLSSPFGFYGMEALTCPQ